MYSNHCPFRARSRPGRSPSTPSFWRTSWCDVARVDNKQRIPPDVCRRHFRDVFLHDPFTLRALRIPRQALLPLSKAVRTFARIRALENDTTKMRQELQTKSEKLAVLIPNVTDGQALGKREKNLDQKESWLKELEARL